MASELPTTQPIRVEHVARLANMEPRELRNMLNHWFSDEYLVTTRIEPTMAVALVAAFNPALVAHFEEAHHA